MREVPKWRAGNRRRRCCRPLGAGQAESGVTQHLSGEPAISALKRHFAAAAGVRLAFRTPPSTLAACQGLRNQRNGAAGARAGAFGRFYPKQQPLLLLWVNSRGACAALRAVRANMQLRYVREQPSRLLASSARKTTESPAAAAESIKMIEPNSNIDSSSLYAASCKQRAAALGFRRGRIATRLRLSALVAAALVASRSRWPAGQTIVVFQFQLALVAAKLRTIQFWPPQLRDVKTFGRRNLHCGARAVSVVRRNAKLV